MWLWIAVAFVVLLAVIIGSLHVPVHAVLDVDTAAEHKFQLHIIWLFGLLKIRLPAARRKPPRWKPPRRARRLPDFRRLLRSVRQFGELRRLARDILSRIKIRQLSVLVRFSTGDPMESGIVMGFISALRPFIALPPQYTIDIQPRFSGDAFFETQGHLDASARPIRFVGPALRLWRVARRIRKS